MRDVCIDARMAQCSGIGTYIREIAPFLGGRLILLVDQEGQSWCQGFEQIVWKAPIYSLREQWEYPLKVPPCDLFWSPHYNVPLLPIRAKKRVVTIHDTCHLVFGSILEKLYAKRMLKRALHSHRVITISQFSKAELMRRMGAKHVEVIPIGVNAKRFFPKTPCEKMKEQYRLPKEFALFVGSHKPHKNLPTAIRAANWMGLPLLAVGKGIHPVKEEELPVLYSMAKLFVFPSLYEGFGLPPLEAMACHCPTAVSHAASIPEVCADASIYFDPKDFKAMGRAMQKTIDAKEDLIAKGQERIKLFSWQKTIERHLQVFEEASRA